MKGRSNRQMKNWALIKQRSPNSLKKTGEACFLVVELNEVSSSRCCKRRWEGEITNYPDSGGGEGLLRCDGVGEGRISRAVAEAVGCVLRAVL